MANFGPIRGEARDGAGNLVPNVWVTVRKHAPGNAFALPLYARGDGAATVEWPDGTMDNPFFSETGEFLTFAVGGDYIVELASEDFSKIWDWVQAGTAQSADVDHYASSGFTWAPESATASPPSNGCVRYNNANVALATHAYIDKDTLGGSDATNWLTAFLPNDWLLVATGVGTEFGWPISSIVNNTAWFDFVLGAYTGPPGPISLGDIGFVTLSRERAAAATVGSVVVKTTPGDVVIGASDAVLILNKASPQATGVTLPAVSTRNNLPLHITDAGGNAGDVTITPNGSEKIQGQSNWIIGSGGDINLYPNAAIGGWYL